MKWMHFANTCRHLHCDERVYDGSRARQRIFEVLSKQEENGRLRCVLRTIWSDRRKLNWIIYLTSVVLSSNGWHLNVLYDHKWVFRFFFVCFLFPTIVKCCLLKYSSFDNTTIAFTTRPMTYLVMSNRFRCASSIRIFPWKRNAEIYLFISIMLSL